MTTRTKREIRSVGGTVIAAGETVTVEPYDITRCRISTTDGRAIRIPSVRAHTALEGFFRPPAPRTIERWVLDGVVDDFWVLLRRLYVWIRF